LVVLGVVLFGVGLWVISVSISANDVTIGPLLCVASLFGILFGPWVGGLTGLVSWLVLFLLHWGVPSQEILIIAVAGFIAGSVPAWLVKDVSNWKLVSVVGVVASLVWAMVFHLGIGIVYGGWHYFWEGSLRLSTMALPSAVVLLPFFAYWLVADKGRWKVVIGTGIVASLLWIVLAALVRSLLDLGLGFAESYDLLEILLFWIKLAALEAIPVVFVLVPLIAFWLAGSVRRWGLYWRDYQ
jgi:hypothetical protein